MKNIELKNKKIIVTLAGFLGVILLGFVVFRPINTKTDVYKIREVSVSSGRNSIKIKSDGLVEFFGADGSTGEQFWGRDKTAAFFEYIKNHADIESMPSSYKVIVDGVTYYISLDNELLSVIFEEFGVAAKKTDELGKIFENHFSSPAPVQPPADLFVPVPTTTGSVGGSDLSICPFWKIGFCVYPTPTPSPQTVPVATPSTIPVEICDLIDKQITTRTVVSNTLCLEDPD